MGTIVMYIVALRAVEKLPKDSIPPKFCFHNLIRTTGLRLRSIQLHNYLSFSFRLSSVVGILNYKNLIRMPPLLKNDVIL